LLALPGENGGDELRVGMTSPPQVADDGIDVKRHAAVRHCQPVAVIFKQEPAGGTESTGHPRAAGVEGTDAVNETIGDEMSVAADDHVSAASAK
jgi:hypothetical protein